MNLLRSKKRPYFKERRSLFSVHWDGMGQHSPQTGFVDTITNSFFYDLWMPGVPDISNSVFVFMKLCISHCRVSSNVFLEMEPQLWIFPRVTSNHWNRNILWASRSCPKIKWDYGSEAQTLTPSAALISLQSWVTQHTTRNWILFSCSRNWLTPTSQYFFEINSGIQFMNGFLVPLKSKGSQHTRKHWPEGLQEAKWHMSFDNSPSNRTRNITDSTEDAIFLCFYQYQISWEHTHTFGFQPLHDWHWRMLLS